MNRCIDIGVCKLQSGPVIPLRGFAENAQLGPGDLRMAAADPFRCAWQAGGVRLA